jgi:hypothetical protein
MVASMATKPDSSEPWLKVRAMLAAEFIVKRRRPILSGLGLLLDRELRSAMVGVYTNFKTLL